MFDPVPWAIGGGAEHSTEVLRTLAYAATGADDGVAEPGDLKVAPLAVPGTSVRVLTGAAAIRARTTGGAQQSYVVRNVTETVVAVASTGSSGGRSDLLAVVVKDPFVAGSTWPVPSNPVTGPYLEAIIVPNVPNTTTRLQDVTGYSGVSGIALARIDLPASTATVTAGMIVDLRRLARPRTRTTVLVASSTGAGRVGSNYVSPDGLTSGSFVKWPAVAEWDVEIPSWASHGIITAQVLGASSRTGDAWGDLKAKIDTVETPVTSYDEAWDQKPQRATLGTAGTLAIPAASRGKTRKVRLEGRRAGGSGHLTAMLGTTTIVNIVFEERIA